MSECECNCKCKKTSETQTEMPKTQAEWDAHMAFYQLAIKERDYERRQVESLQKSIITACERSKDKKGRMCLNAHEMSEEINNLRRKNEKIMESLRVVLDEIQYEDDFETSAYRLVSKIVMENS
jgi:hypothetical protein